MKRLICLAAGSFVLVLGGCAHRTAAVPVSTAPASQAVFARQVKEARIAGEGDPAVRILRQRLAAAPDSIDLRLEIARHYEASGYPDLALEHVRLARIHAPGHAQLLAEEARLLIKQDLAGEAVRILQSAAQDPAASATVHAWLGIALDESGDLASGERSHRAALALAPSDDTFLNNLGYNLIRQGRPEEAIRALESALQANRDNALVRSNLARALVARDAVTDPSGAVAHWSVAVDPASAHNNLAAALIEQGSYDNARRELNAALAIERKHIAAWNNLRLVSELDGLPPTTTAVRHQGRWQRFAAIFKNAFGDKSPSAQPTESPNQRASRQ